MNNPYDPLKRHRHTASSLAAADATHRPDDNWRAWLPTPSDDLFRRCLVLRATQLAEGYAKQPLTDGQLLFPGEPVETIEIAGETRRFLFLGSATAHGTSLWHFVVPSPIQGPVAAYQVTAASGSTHGVWVYKGDDGVAVRLSLVDHRRGEHDSWFGVIREGKLLASSRQEYSAACEAEDEVVASLTRALARAAAATGADADARARIRSEIAKAVDGAIGRADREFVERALSSFDEECAREVLPSPSPPRRRVVDVSAVRKTRRGSAR